LIAGSFFERNNIGAFIWARILRIYPALIMAVFFCTFIVGLFFTKESWLSYIDDPIIYKFFVKNITLLFGVEYYLPSVFNENPYKNAVNGSIWTLPYEIKMYSYLAISGIILNYLEKFIGNWLVKISFLLVAVFVIITYILEHFNLPTQEPFFCLFLMFFTGVAFYLWRGYVCMSKSVFIVLIIILSISIVFNKQLFFIGYIIFLPYLVFYVAYIPSGFVRNFNKFGDYSYGIYLYAFPLQQ
jgi:peptidoglycan/LPS O-acetylase OafA/YrhL